MGGAVSSGENNDALIDNLIEADYIKNPQIERVFRAVDRAFYYLDDFKKIAYKDIAWKHGNLHLSAPCIYSQVMESLELKPGLSFLNLGSGTGYLSTMVGLILGSSGINHGIEIHADVIDYAQERLRAFIKQNQALDEYDFCIPQFVQGNCLSMSPANRRYNRVYCGAACPEIYESYMKQLLHIGGILVMPMNDQLLQIRREDENTWTVNSVLPVSFASLLTPQPETAEDINLPPVVSHSLQDTCRFAIRKRLRNIIKTEHPDLWLRSRKHPKQKCRPPVLRRCVVPIFEESDSDTQSLPEMDQGRDSREQNLSFDEEDEEEEFERSDFADVGDRRSGIRRAEAENSEEVGRVKREKIDSGVSDLYDSSNEADTSTRPAESQPAPSTTATGAEASIQVDTEENAEPCSSNNNSNQNVESRARRALSGIRLFTHNLSGERDRAALVIFESRSPRSTTADTGHSDTEMTGEEMDDSCVVPEENYTYFMKRKIRALPLPPALKSFLNYHREL